MAGGQLLEPGDEHRRPVVVGLPEGVVHQGAERGRRVLPLGQPVGRLPPLLPRQGATQAGQGVRLVRVVVERPGVRLLVAGSGDAEEAVEDLPAAVRAAVTFLGVVSEADKMRLLRSVDVYVAPYMTKPDGVAVVAQQPSVRLVQLLSAGFDNMLPVLPEGVSLANAKGVHDAATAELALTLVLASQRGFDDFARAQAQGEWASRRVRPGQGTVPEVAQVVVSQQQDVRRHDPEQTVVHRQEAVLVRDGKVMVAPRLVASLKSFARMWDCNLKAQGYVAAYERQRMS